MKRILSLCLSLLLLAGALTGCVGTPEQTEPETTQQEDTTLRILMIGASLGFDTMYMLPAVAQNEGVTDFVFGMMYRSAGLNHHAKYVQSDKPEYAYFEYVSGQDQVWRRADCNGNFIYHIPSAANDTYIEDGSIAVNADFGLKRMDWDVVIMLPSSSEITGRISGDPMSDLNIANAGVIMDHVKQHDIDPTTVPEFGWHMSWSMPADETLWNDARRTYLEKYFNSDANAMFEANMKTSKEVVAPALEGKVKYIFPCAAALQNAKSASCVEDKDIHRDFIHGTDYARLIAAYVWYCQITGTNIRDCKFGPVPNGIVRDNIVRNSGKDYEISEQWKQVLIESVENAIAHPYELTQSQY